MIISEIEKAKIIDIYNRTNFGIVYIARMFNINKWNIQSVLYQENIKPNKKTGGGGRTGGNCNIRQKDIILAEEILCHKIPFEIKLLRCY